jgi:uncharacterized repeat protein (TIGR01451 family)
MKNTLSALFLFFSWTVFSQNIVVDYKNPTTVNLCDTVTFEVVAKNTDSKTANTVSIYIELPNGLSYLKNSVSNGTEKTLTSSQIFDFDVKDIPGNGSLKLTFKAYTDCKALAELNSGVLFSNVIIVTYGSNQASILTEPYEVVTPLPIIVSMTDPYIKGGKSQILDRQIVIENTRLGSLRSFTFEDNHEGGMTVASKNGKTILSNGKQLHLLFSSVDFVKIGDGDAFFENGEQIVINEKILVTDCGDLVPKSTSTMNILWGCDTKVCKTERFSAVVDILRTNLSATLSIEPFYTKVLDHCAQKSDKQGVVITNTGKDTSYNGIFTLNMPNTFNIRKSFVLTNGASKKPIQPISFFAKKPLACTVNEVVDTFDVFNLPNLAPNQSITLEWDYLACADCLAGIKPLWEAKVTFAKDCPKGTGSGSILIYQEIFEPYVYNSFAKYTALKDNDTLGVQMVFVPAGFKDSTGTMGFKLVLPCGIKWTSGKMQVAGKDPLSFNISADGKTITGEYALPLPDSAVGNYTLKFNCDPKCHKIVDNYFDVFSNCKNFFPLNADYQTQKDTAIFDAYTKAYKGAIGCGIRNCEKLPFDLDCTKNVTKTDTVAGYSDTSIKFYRLNLGTPDNDNDRLEDGSGTIDHSKIKKDHFLVGDTAFYSMKSKIFAQKDNSFQKARINTSFEIHLIDVNVKKYGIASKLKLDKTDLVPMNLVFRIFDHKLNTYYNCQLPLLQESIDSIDIKVQNVLPYGTKDAIFYLIHQYELDTKTLVGLPPNFLFTEGDSILLEGKYFLKFTDFTLLNNKVPVAKSLRINAGTTVYNNISQPKNKYYCGSNEIFFHVCQLGMYQNLLKYPLLDCQPTKSDILRFTYGVVKEYPNFFPYEFRVFSKMPTLELNIYNPFDYLAASAKEWKTQGGPVHFTNQPINFTNIGFYKYRLDFLPFQVVPQDEGFSVIIENTFLSKCIDKLDDRISMKYSVNQYNPIKQDEIYGYNQPSIPNTVFSVNYNTLIVKNLYEEYNSFDNTAKWEFIFDNSSAFTTPFPYLYFTNLKGVSDIKVIDKATGVEIKPINGLYNLPDVQPNKSYNIQICAINNTCDEANLDANYGWNCSKINAVGEKSCTEKKIKLYVSPTPGEIEMRIETPSDTTQMCDPTSYFNIDVSSVRFGAVFNPTLSFILPAGLSIAPNSAQVAYPANSGNFIDIPDPKPLPNGNLGWNLADFVDKIKQNGLAGVGQKPQNVVRLRFKMKTKCGFLAGKNFSAKIEGFEICGKKTNEITRASKPLFLKGVTPIYSTKIQFKPLFAGLLKCDQVAKFSIRSIATGTTGDLDSIYVYLPLHVQYLQYDVTNNNSPKAAPTIETTATQRILKWKMPKGVGPGAYVGLVIYTKGWGSNSCKNDEILVKTVQRQETTCSTSGELCSVSSVTGQTNSLIVPVAHPSYAVKNVTASFTKATGILNFKIDVENLNTADSVKGITVDLYNDLNGNKVFDPTTDVFLGTKFFDLPFKNGKTTTIVGDITSNVPPNAFCNLILVIDKEKNCACQTVAIPIENILVLSDAKTVCSGKDIELGLPSSPNSTYSWQTTTSLSCGNCSNPIFNFVNNLDISVNKSNKLDVKTGTCNLTLFENIVVFPKPKIKTLAPAICKGEKTTLTTTQGKTFNWSGAGISDPTATTQTVSPTTSSLYKVTITDENNCTGTDEVVVKVGGGVGNGKDTICQGKSLIINGKTFDKKGKYAINFKVGNNCDSIYNLDLAVVDTFFQVKTQVKVFIGDSIQLSGPSGYTSYLWTPAAFLSCTTCQNPIAKPLEDNVLYTLKVKDSKGCQGSTNTELSIVPNCKGEGIIPVKVFIPNGENEENRSFRFVGLPVFGVTANLTIVNRWGEVIMDVKNHPNPTWDGIFNRQDAPQDAYIIIYEIFCGGTSIKKDSIDCSLLR